MGQPESFFNSAISSFQTFTLDANYGEILTGIISSFTPKILVVIFAFLLLVGAPIVGGAAILTVVSNIFPIFQFNIGCFFSHKDVYVFSCLNDQTLSLAETLMIDSSGGKWSLRPRALFVFASTWVDEGSEVEVNLVIQAKSLGAICVKEDLLKLRLWKKSRASYFLVDENDMRNIQNAIDLSDKNGAMLWKDCQTVSIYLYAQSDWAYEVVENIFQKNKEETQEQKMMIYVIPYITYTIYRLLTEYPFFRQYRLPPHEREINTIVLIGEDDWIIQIFKAVFWCCQLPDKPLRLVSISSDPTWLQEKIRFQIPELDIMDNDEPYASVVFLDGGKNSVRLDSVLAMKTLQLWEANNWFVSLGNDDRNVEVSLFLKHRLDAINLKDHKGSMVHVLIEDHSLMLNLNMDLPGEPDMCQIHAFGSLQDQYSTKNFQGGLFDIAWIIDNKWLQRQQAESRTVDGEYRRRSSLASVLHTLYKLYYLDLLPREISGEKHDSIEMISQGLRAYQEHNYSEFELYMIGYIEHRRWNAYTRSEGFRQYPLQDWLVYDKKQSKDFGRKMHICLAEYRREPKYPVLLTAEDGNLRLPEEKSDRFAGLDSLDLVSWNYWKLSRKNEPLDQVEFKHFDVYILRDLSKGVLAYDSLVAALNRYKKESGTIHESTKIGTIIHSTHLKCSKRTRDDFNTLLLLWSEELSGCSDTEDAKQLQKRILGLRGSHSFTEDEIDQLTVQTLAKRITAESTIEKDDRKEK